MNTGTSGGNRDTGIDIGTVLQAICLYFHPCKFSKAPAARHSSGKCIRVPPKGRGIVDASPILLALPELLVHAICRSESHVRLPDMPFCMTPGCINGPRQRDRMAALRDALGYSNFETDEDKQWQQILMH